MENFPRIDTFEDIAPAIQGRKDIVVSHKPGYCSVFYTIRASDTFDRTRKGLLRRECRGLIFDVDYKGRPRDLLARPFHKFFNAGENEETQPHNIDLSAPHVIQEKLDGTLVFPFLPTQWGRLNSENPGFELKLATKAGITEEAETAMALLAELDPGGERRAWLRECVEAGLTPCLEHIGDDPRRVLRYERPELVLLAVRERHSGRYVAPPAPYPGPVVDELGAVGGSIRDYIARVRSETGREGDVLVFADGLRVKFKSDWYVRIHQVKDQAEHPRHIAQATLDNTLDDMLGVLPEPDRKEVLAASRRFADALNRKLGGIEQMLAEMEAWLRQASLVADPSLQHTPEKSVALEFARRLASKADLPFCFARLKGRDVRALFELQVRKGLTRDSRYTALLEWLEAPTMRAPLEEEAEAEISP